MISVSKSKFVHRLPVQLKARKIINLGGLLLKDSVYFNQGGGTNGSKNVTATEIQLTVRAFAKRFGDV